MFKFLRPKAAKISLDTRPIDGTLDKDLNDSSGVIGSWSTDSAASNERDLWAPLVEESWLTSSETSLLIRILKAFFGNNDLFKNKSDDDFFNMLQYFKEEYATYDTKITIPGYHNIVFVSMRNIYKSDDEHMYTS
jgi:hypothetical protein